MPAAVTASFRVVNARQFVDSFEEFENGGRETVVGHSYVYLFIGKILSWDKTHAGYSDTVVPSPDTDVQGIEFEPWRDMIAVDRIYANTDISFGGKRYNWTSGTVYTQYDDQDAGVVSGTAAFYVYTAAGNIFKCLDNNLGSQSSVQPSKPSASVETPFMTSDGYRWKYMSTLPNSDATTFLTTNYLPLRTLNNFTEISSPPDGYGDLATVQGNANNGTLETFVVFNGGSGYTAHSGGVSDVGRVTTGDAASNSTFLVLTSATGVSTDADYYNGASIYLSNSTFEKGVARIADYGTLGIGSGSTAALACLLDPGFAEHLAPLSGATENYHIGPRIDIIGDGDNANAYSICTAGGAVSQIKTWEHGNNYSTANVVTIQPDNGAGSGAQARAIVPPHGGHGFDQVSELGGFNIIVAKTISGAGTGNTFPIENQYRNIGLVRNPYLKEGWAGHGSGVTPVITKPATDGKNWYANTTPLHQSLWIRANTTHHKSTGDFAWTPTQDDEVKGNTTGATGRIIEYNSDGRAILNITNLVANSSGGSFIDEEQIGRLRDIAGVEYDPTLYYVTANGYVEDGGLSQIPHDGTSIVLYDQDLAPFTGDILYIENRTPITRSTDQAEDIKIVIEF